MRRLVQNVHCSARLRHWNLTPLEDMPVGYKSKVRMYLNLIFVGDSADGVKRHTQKIVARSVRSIPGLMSVPRTCNKQLTQWVFFVIYREIINSRCVDFVIA